MKLNPNHPTRHARRVAEAKRKQEAENVYHYESNQLSLRKAVKLDQDIIPDFVIRRHHFGVYPFDINLAKNPSSSWFSQNFLQDGILRKAILETSYMKLGFLAPNGELISLIKRYIRNPVRLHLRKYVPWKFTLKAMYETFGQRPEGVGGHEIMRDFDGDNIPDTPGPIREHTVT